MRAGSASDISEGRVPGVDALRDCRLEVQREVARCAKAPPRFSGNVALLLFSSGAQVHPLVAVRWAQRFPEHIVIAANAGYLPGRVNFSVRSREPRDLIAFLRGLDCRPSRASSPVAMPRPPEAASPRESSSASPRRSATEASRRTTWSGEASRQAEPRCAMRRRMLRLSFALPLLLLSSLLACSTEPEGPTTPSDCDRFTFSLAPAVAATHVSLCSSTSCGNGMNPPTAGPHCPYTLSCQSYDTEQPPCQWLHNLEHGHAVFLYELPRRLPRGGRQARAGPAGGPCSAPMGSGGR